MRHVSIGIYLTEAVARSMKKIADERGESFSKIAMEIIEEGLAEIDPEELKNSGKPTSISISPEIYDELRKFAKTHNFQVGHIIRKLLERWYWHSKSALVEG